MPNTHVPANATGLPAAIMWAAVSFARASIEGERERYLRRWAGAIRCGERHPPMVLPTWRAAMLEAQRWAWAEAKSARAAAPAPEAIAELASVELQILSIQAAERITRDERHALASLTARAASLSAVHRASAHIHN